jgi:multiple sugar transport system substrate-binding protein
MKLRRHRAALVTIVVGTLVAAACTSNEPEPPEDQTTVDEPQTIDIWAFEGEADFLPRLINAFEDEHPNITVKLTNIPEDNYVTKIDTALAAGSPPDLGYLYETRWITAGRILPIDDVIASENIDVSQFNQNAFSGCVVDGKTYCLGSYTGAILMFYNKDLFDEAGEPYPSATEPMTVDEYAAVAERLTQRSDDRSDYVWGGFAEPTDWWMDWRVLFSEDGRMVEGYLNDAPTVHMYDVLATMVRDGTSPTESDFEFFGDTDPLATGQMAMTFIDNIVAIPTLEKAEIPWGAAPTPVEKEGDLPWVGSWTDSWSIFSDTDQAAAAKAFLGFVATEGNRLRARAGQQPLNNAIAEEEDWAGDSSGRADALEVAKLARPNIFLPAGIFTIDGPLWDAFGLMVEENMNPQQAMDQAATDIQSNLDRAWSTYEQI